MKDIFIRALKTFIQGFLGALAIALPTTDITQAEVVKSVLIGAVAAGVSALMNFIIKLLEKGEKNGNN